MDKEKTYPMGWVKISSEEYRDIVSRIVVAEAEVDRLGVERWELRKKCDELEKQIESLKANSKLRDSFMRNMDDGK